MTEPERSKPWVRLHLAPQSEGTMPQMIIGKLDQETDRYFVLTNVLEASEERTHKDFISRTYVWRCEILGTQKPDLELDDDFGYEGGGLG